MEDVVTLEHSLDTYEPSLTPDSLGKLGMWLFLISDAMSFGALLAAYGAIRAGAAAWVPPVDILGINLTAFMTFLLICSSVTMVKALESIQDGKQSRMCLFLGLTILGGVVFLGLQAYEWTHLINKHGGLTLTELPEHGLKGGAISGSPLFGATFYVITGFHGLHVTGGVIYLICILIQGLRGQYTADYNHKVEILGLYWHFVDLVWIMVFTFVYLL